jgi:hypothetical protein
MGNEQPHQGVERMRILPQVWGSYVPPDLPLVGDSQAGLRSGKDFRSYGEYPSTPYLS